MTALAESTTIGSLRRDVATMLRQAFDLAGSDATPALDARLLVAHALASRASEIVLRDNEPAGEHVRAAAMGLAARRIAGEPVARILGHKEFWGLDFQLSAETLVPRPDTETLVAAALGTIERAGAREAPLLVLDIGTGSGAILLALLSELPAATGVGTDRAAEAIATARANAVRLGLAARSRFVVADWANGIRSQFHCIVANPPYVRSDRIAALPVEVAKHDPRLALDGGEDGLVAYRAILAGLDGFLALRGRAFFEVGMGQSEAVAGLAESAGFESRSHRDLSQIDRVVELWRATGG